MEEREICINYGCLVVCSEKQNELLEMRIFFLFNTGSIKIILVHFIYLMSTTMNMNK